LKNRYGFLKIYLIAIYDSKVNNILDILTVPKNKNKRKSAEFIVANLKFVKWCTLDFV
jgi:hypothetical protein